jgi:hypothetical protein
MRRRRRLAMPCAANACHFDLSLSRDPDPKSDTFDRIYSIDKRIVCCGAGHVLLASSVDALQEACRTTLPCHVYGGYIRSTRGKEPAWLVRKSDIIV